MDLDENKSLAKNQKESLLTGKSSEGIEGMCAK